MKLQGLTILLVTVAVSFASCRNETSDYYWKTIKVTVSAYNSVSWQTDSLNNIAAWGDTLKPGMKCVAVSRDLMKQGLGYNTPLKIEGLPGIYLVKDKMHFRWRNKIDIYMGRDVRGAKNWGRKKLHISYPVKRDSIQELP